MNPKEIIKNIDTLSDKYIIIGVSAGPDSMALLHLTSNITNKEIVCAHINHNLRKESKDEELYLKKYCQEHNIIFESTKILKYSENNLENEARKKRYRFYEKILKKYHSHTLLLAHHGDDLIETILMKIVRGSNLEGYAGIKTYSKQKDYTIIRPFLSITKEDILKYNKENNITYYEDITNTDDSYTRNRYRKNILPLLKKENNCVHLSFLKYSNKLQSYYNYIEDVVKEKIALNYNRGIDLDTFNKEHPFIKENIIFYLLSDIYNNEANIIKDKHIDSILALCESKNANASVNLPKNIIAQKRYNTLTIEKCISKESNNYKKTVKKENKFDNMIIKLEKTCNTDGNNVCRLNTKNIDMPIYFRNKLPGDYIYLLGTNGKKKIKEVFIEAKVPLEKRKNYPILVDNNNNILWIPNLKKSKYCVKKDELYDIILTSYDESEEKNEKQAQNK